MNRRFRSRLPFAAALLVLGCAALTAGPARAQDNQCDAGEFPDVIVGDLHQTFRWGSASGRTAYSIGTVSCNVGTCWLEWDRFSNKHPVIGQNLFRLKDGRFEQVGQAWLKHGFNALSQQLCNTGCIPTAGGHLGVNCSDPYGTNLNGKQDGMGPKFEVDPVSGFHPHPPTDFSQTGGVLYKRLQVLDADLDPSLNAGAQYFAEGHYIAEDDSAAGLANNNASYRQVSVLNSGGDFELIFEPQFTTQRTRPGIQAWKDNDPDVNETIVDVPSDGRFILAAKATDLGGGTWHYEYAIQNLNSQRAAHEFVVPVPSGATVTNVGFHDVDYHSGEPYGLTDWASAVAATDVSWATDDASVDGSANALRWGTLYNYRFDADGPPDIGASTLGMFETGSPSDVNVLTIVPGVCNSNAFCDAGETCKSCPGDCPGTGPDNDGDLFSVCVDCNDTTAGLWDTPGEVLDVEMDPTSTLTWNPPSSPGSTVVTYEALRSSDPSDFTTGTDCLTGSDPEDTSLTDPSDPGSGDAFFYLIRATNLCPIGDGSLGSGTPGPRSGVACS